MAQTQLQSLCDDCDHDSGFPAAIAIVGHAVGVDVVVHHAFTVRGR